MDITFITGTGVLLVAAVLLLLTTSGEAVFRGSNRRLENRAPDNGGPGAMGRHSLQKYHSLRAVSVATEATLSVGSVTAAFLAFRSGDATVTAVMVTVLITFLFVALLRQSARKLTHLYLKQLEVALARPIRVLTLIFGPLGWITEVPINLLLRILGRSRSVQTLDPVDEFAAILDTSGVLASDGSFAEQRRMVRGILAMSSQSVRELMSPRMDLRAVSTDASVGDVMKLIVDSGFSRIPLYEDSIDHVIGIIYAKDLLAHLQAGQVHPDLREIARRPYFVPETKRANELLSEMRRDQLHMAVALDEYGGTAGVVTVEDLLEEIVGEIADEYDTGESDIKRISDDQAIVDARLPVDEMNELFGTTIDSEDFDTVGGLIFSLLGRLASPGDQVMSEEHGLQLRVLSIMGRRIRKVRVERIVTVDETEEASTG